MTKLERYRRSEMWSTSGNHQRLIFRHELSVQPLLKRQLVLEPHHRDRNAGNTSESHHRRRGRRYSAVASASAGACASGLGRVARTAS